MELTANLHCDRYRYARDKVREISKGQECVVFDLGAGDGTMARLLDSPEIDYHGFDKKPQQSDFICWDLERQLSCNALRKADIVLLLDVLEHVWNPQLALANAMALLKPYGFAILSFPNPLWSRSRFYFMKSGELPCFTRRDLESNHHVFTSWPHVIERLLFVGGLIIKEYVTLESKLAWPNRPLSASYPVRVLTHLLSRLLEFKNKAAMGMNYAVMAQKRSC